MTTEPQTAVRAGWLNWYGFAWLGVWLAQLTVIQLLLPQQVAESLPPIRGVGIGDTGTIATFGLVSAAAGLVALVVFPLVGALSDRTASRFGRRRPWVVAGTLVFAAGLQILGMQHTAVGLTIGWCVALGGFAAVASALTAYIADQVPVRQRGLVSSFIGAPQAIGTVLGLVLVTSLALPESSAYSMIAVLLVLLVIPFVLRVDDPPHDVPHDRLGAAGVIGGVWIDPKTHPDFAWTLAGRTLINLGNAVGTTLLLYFLADGLKVLDPANKLVPLVLVYLACLVVATVLGGRLSDVLHRRRIFVAVAALLQSAAAILIVWFPSYDTTMVAGALLGAGYGAFLSVDQALATQVLPDAADRGKDLGIMNIAAAVPQAFGPIIGAGVLAIFGGFGAVFATAAILSLLGVASVYQVRSVR